MVHLGAKPVYLPLHPPSSEHAAGVDLKANDWKINMEELEAAFNDKTKIILINTPNNPLGKVFSKEELEAVADLCKKHDVICVSDEVYEWMVYEDGCEHVRMACLPGMWERTLTVCSAGKTFNTTGDVTAFYLSLLMINVVIACQAGNWAGQLVPTIC